MVTGQLISRDSGVEASICCLCSLHPPKTMGMARILLEISDLSSCLVPMVFPSNSHSAPTLLKAGIWCVPSHLASCVLSCVQSTVLTLSSTGTL